MSDYLGNLAARVLGRAELVRPRLASRFEPSPPLEEHLLRTRSDREDLEPVSSLEVPVPDQIPAPRPPTPQTQPPEVITDTAGDGEPGEQPRAPVRPAPQAAKPPQPIPERVAEPPSRPQRPAVSSPTTEAVPGTPTAPRPTVSPPAVSPPAAMAAFTASAIASPRGVPRNAVPGERAGQGTGLPRRGSTAAPFESVLPLPRTTPAPAPAVGSAIPQTPREATSEPPAAGSPVPLPAPARREVAIAPPASTAPPRLSAQQSAIQEVVAERLALAEQPKPWQTATHVESPAALARVVVRPQVAPLREPAVPLPGQPAEALPPAPTIRVTIGRVEVRAVHPPPPTPKPSPPKPRLSLDEYLRSGGRS